jgi:hypothetical protein
MWQTQTLAQLKGLIPKTQKIYHVMILFDLLCLTPLSAIFQLYHGDQF